MQVEVKHNPTGPINMQYMESHTLYMIQNGPEQWADKVGKVVQKVCIGDDDRSDIAIILGLSSRESSIPKHFWCYFDVIKLAPGSTLICN